MSLPPLINRINKAIQVEEDAQFSDIWGQNESFSGFMRRSFSFIFKEHQITTASELSRKYAIYQTLDLPSRMDLVKNTKRILLDLTNEPKTVKPTTKEFKAKSKLWETDVKWVPGVGETASKILNRLGIFTVYDLLCYWPREHLDFSKRVYIKDLKVGLETTILGMVTKVTAFQSPRNPNLAILTVRISDPTGTVSINKFIAGRSNKFILEGYKKQFPINSLVLVSGRVQFDKQTRYQLANFSAEVIEERNENEEAQTESLEVGRVVPVYRLTEGLNQGRLRKIIFKALDRFSNELEETLPESITQEFNFLSLKKCVAEMHFPESLESLEQAKKRIIFEEFLLLNFPLAIKRYELRKSAKPRSLELKSKGLVEKFLQILPFELTGAQRKVFEEIMLDLQKDRPMSRLVQGDVGSGKTVVALLAMLLAVDNGKQAAMMAPTEILAEQHFRKFQEWMTQIGVKVALLIGSQRAAERREVLTGLANGQVQIVVGTHALIQEGVDFSSLGLVVIDEQHRFGVKQRDLLRKKGENNDIVDCLFMTATPIPRTLALAMHGNLDLSEIDELPPGRKPIRTRIVEPKNRVAAHEFVKKQLAEGRQAYIVYPLIDESESLSAKAVTEEAQKLKKTYKDFEVGIVHGKLSPEEKESVMSAFRKNEIQVLVGTTVIEVGVDVPNSTIMIIENAERFGLSQLHQLRGRVGRGSEQSYCFLFTDSKAETTQERLQILEKTENGFVIAQEDLRLRGPGELIGTRQSGLSDFGLASLASHGELLEQTRNIAIEAIEQDPQLSQFPTVFRERVNQSMERLSSLGGG